MTDDRSLERAARSWLEAGPTEAPDRAVEAALLQIQATPQERDLRIPWRLPKMTTPARVATAAVIGVLAVGGALVMLGRPDQSGVGGPGPSPTPAVSVAPSTSPTAPAPSTGSAAPSNAGPPALPEGPLAAGTYVVTPFAPGRLGASCTTPPLGGCSESEDDSFRATLTVPDGWAGVDSLAIWLPAEHNSAPAGAAVAFNRGGWLNSHPCLTEAQLAANVQPDVAVGPGVDDFASALGDHPLLEATEPVPVTLGGYSGKYVDLQLPTDLTGCTSSYYPWAPTLYAQGSGHRWHLSILDVDGMRIVVMAMDYAGTSAQHQAELQAIVDSIQIER